MDNKTDNKTTEFRVIENGPLHVKGNFVLQNPDGTQINVEKEAWLCRCGNSKNKPFCDGSHRPVGFRG